MNFLAFGNAQKLGLAMLKMGLAMNFLDLAMPKMDLGTLKMGLAVNFLALATLKTGLATLKGVLEACTRQLKPGSMINSFQFLIIIKKTKMHNDQRVKFDSYLRVQAYNTKYAAALAAIPDYTALQTAFDNNVTQVINASRQQQQTNGATSEMLTTLKRNMAETVIEFAGRSVVKAHLAGNEALANQLDEPAGYIFYADKIIAVQRAQVLRNLMNDNLAALTSIAAADITAIDEAINAYASKMNDPVLQVEHKKSQGTGTLPALFKTTDAVLDNMYRLVKSYFFRTQPPMVAEMGLAMQAINTGIRHTIVNITLLDETNAPIEGGEAVDNSNGKKYTSDYTGLVHIEKHKIGHDTFTITAPGKQQVTIGMDIKRGTENKLMVKMMNV